MKLNKLTPLEITNATRQGRLSDGGGLYVQIIGNAKVLAVPLPTRRP
jgi:hypothetical protein